MKPKWLTFVTAAILVTGLATCSTPQDTPSLARGTALVRNFTLPVPLFMEGSAWRQTVSSAAVLPENDAQILYTYRKLRDPEINWPFMDINYDDYSIPIFKTGTGTQSVLLCDYDGVQWWPGPKFPEAPDLPGGPITVPANLGDLRPANPQGIDSDGHLVLYDPTNHHEYDFWGATTQRTGECESLGGGQVGPVLWEAGAADHFDVLGEGVNLPTLSSARAVGTPLLAGLILPEDIASGAIQHALAAAVPGLRNMAPNPDEPLESDYFYPATTTETDHYNQDAASLAAGQRLRLKSTLVDDGGDPLDETDLAPITRMFLQALRSYGAYVVDNAGGFTFYAEDIHTANLDLPLAELNTLVGLPTNTPLPAGTTQWQLVIETLNDELMLIPIAYGPWTDGQEPGTAQITTANFDVVAPAIRPTQTTTSTIYLPLIQNTPTPPVPADQPFALDQVKFWAYQIQGLDLPGEVDALVASHYDMLVLEPTRTDWSSDTRNFNTAEMVARVKTSKASDGIRRKLAIAYIDIGEAEDWRWYWTWSTGWDCTGPKPADWPAYILICDPDGWTGNYPVAYWDAAWKDIIIHGKNQDSTPYGNYTSVLDEVLKDGFDGVYLDWVEGFENDAVIAAAQQAGRDPAEEMRKFIEEIQNYGRARNPDFIVIQQNAAELADWEPGLLNVIDAIAQEGIWYDGTATDNWDELTGYFENDPGLTAYYLEFLQLYQDANIPLFNCDYTIDQAAQAYTKAYAQGYIPYVTRRSLGHLTTTPPPGY